MPGEDRRVLRDGQIVEELSGSKGRKSYSHEWDEAQSICKSLGFVFSDEFGADYTQLSFPECNDRLLRLLGRAKWRLQRLHSLSWRLKDGEQQKRAIEELKNSNELQDLLGLTEVRISDKFVKQFISPKFKELRESLPCVLAQIANRVLPLKDGRWTWSKHPAQNKNYILQRDWEKDFSRPQRRIRGQRGLSFSRIEQLEKLRQLTQGINRALAHTLGEKPKHGKATRGEERPDPCPEILEKINHAKDQRVNQTAHMILAEALGVRLREKESRDKYTHGEYEKSPGRDPVDFIVLEDLSRYLSSQDRPRRENSRLMRWAHRAILLKLKDLSELYGLPIIEVNASYSSRFCASSGIPGFRAVEYTPRHRAMRMRYYENRGNLSEKDNTEYRHLCRLFDNLDRANTGREKTGKSWRTLLAPLRTGPLFISASPPYAVRHADINAAINIALRAISAPNCFDVRVRVPAVVKNRRIFPRKLSKLEKSQWSSFGRGIEIKFTDDWPKDSISKNYFNFFVDKNRMARYERAHMSGPNISLANSRGFWGTIEAERWEIVNKLNAARLQRWGLA